MVEFVCSNMASDCRSCSSHYFLDMQGKPVLLFMYMVDQCFRQFVSVNHIHVGASFVVISTLQTMPATMHQNRNGVRMSVSLYTECFPVPYGGDI